MRLKRLPRLDVAVEHGITQLMNNCKDSSRSKESEYSESEAIGGVVPAFVEEGAERSRVW